MRKFNITTQAFLSSVLSIVLCVVMLIGTSFAWYTDGVNVNAGDIQAGQFDEKSEVAETTAENNSTTADTDETTTQESTTETIAETTTEIVPESTTGENMSQLSTTEATTTEPVTEKTTATTETESTTSQEEKKEISHIVDGNEFDAQSAVDYSNESVKAEVFVTVRKSVDKLTINKTSAEVDNVIVIEEGQTVNTVTISDCDFLISEGGQIIVNNSEKTDIDARFVNVTVNGEKITTDNVSGYLSGISDSPTVD